MRNKLDDKSVYICAIMLIVVLVSAIVLRIVGDFKDKQRQLTEATVETEELTVVSRDDVTSKRETEPLIETETEVEVERITETEPQEVVTEPQLIETETETETETESILSSETESIIVSEPVINGIYLGTFMITGYSAEAGFPAGQATHSGYPVGPGVCAMNYSQRLSLGIEWGEQLYIEGLGTFIIYDSGCPWGIVDIWVETNAQAYAMTEYYEVYLLR